MHYTVAAVKGWAAAAAPRPAPTGAGGGQPCAPSTCLQASPSLAAARLDSGHASSRAHCCRAGQLVRGCCTGRGALGVGRVGVLQQACSPRL